MTNRITERIVFALPLIFFAALCVIASFGCAGVRPKPALSVLECRVHLLEPYFGELAPELVQATIGGKPELLVKSLDELGVSLEEILELSKAWKACNPKAPPVTVVTPEKS